MLSTFSQCTLTLLHMKVELETARGRVSLHDNAASKFDLPPNGRHDVIIRHDVKEVGQHTLVCSVTYTAGDGERRYLPQHFKFTSSNPLSVRTKARIPAQQPLLVLRDIFTLSLLLASRDLCLQSLPFAV